MSNRRNHNENQDTLATLFTNRPLHVGNCLGRIAPDSLICLALFLVERADKCQKRLPCSEKDYYMVWRPCKGKKVSNYC